MNPATADQASALRRMAQRRATGEAPPRRGPVIAIASGKGGVGKTTIAVSLAIGLAKRGHKTALLDADLGLANADLVCGLRPTARLTEAVACVARGGRVSADLVRRIAMPGPAGVLVVPGMVGPLAGASPFDARTAVAQTVAVLSNAMGVVVVDHGAGLGETVIEGLRASALPIVVATPDPASLADAYALIKSIHAQGCERVPYLLINRARDAGDAQDAHARVAEVAARFLGLALPMIGHVPEDEAVRRCTRVRRPVALAARRSNAWRHLERVVVRVAEDAFPDAGDAHRPLRSRHGRLARLVRGR